MRKTLPEGSREAVREGVAEVREKLREDLSRWARARRAVSLKPMLSCMECDGAGRRACASCGGSGKGRVGADGAAPPCVHCDAQGTLTCVECAGSGLVPNTNRKRLLVVLWLGVAAWVLVFLRLYLMEHDVLPAFRARGGGASTGVPRGAAMPGAVGQPGAPAAGMGPGAGGGGYQAPTAGYGAPARQPGGMAGPRGGGYSAPRGGGYSAGPGG